MTTTDDGTLHADAVAVLAAWTAPDETQDRLRRRDEKLNEQLVPLFDPGGRLFLASEDPVPINFENNLKELELKLEYGVVSINEVRSAEGLEPVPWGDVPWLPARWLPTYQPRQPGPEREEP